MLTLIRHLILRQSTPGKSTPSRVSKEAVEHHEDRFEGLVIALFPVVAFFGWLYYTDMISLVLVLSSYLLSLKRRWGISAFVGLFPSLPFFALTFQGSVS